MSTGVRTVFKLTMTSGQTKSPSIDLGRAWTTVFLEVPTMASGDLYIHGSSDGINFRRVSVDNGNTTTTHQDFLIKSACTQRFIPIYLGGLTYMKIENTSGATDVITSFNVVCGD